MRDAAEAVGWEASDGALRTLASEYRKAGYFITVAHGAIRFDRDRIQTALDLIFDPVPDPDQQLRAMRGEDGGAVARSASPQELTAEADDAPNENEKPEEDDVMEAGREQRRLVDDFLDDDLPF